MLQTVLKNVQTPEAGGTDCPTMELRQAVEKGDFGRACGLLRQISEEVCTLAAGPEGRLAAESALLMLERARALALAQRAFLEKRLQAIRSSPPGRRRGPLEISG